MTQAMRAIARFEITRSLRRPFSWVVLALAQGFMAVLFLLMTVQFLGLNAQLQAQGVSRAIMIPYFRAAALLVVVVTPMLTMGVLSGDRRDGKLDFLFSAPVSSFDIVAGKLLAVLSCAGALWFLVSLIPLTLLWGAPIDLGIYFTNLLGLALFLLLHCCIGIAASAITRQPVLAGFAALIVSLSLWFADWANRLDPASSSLGTVSTLGRLRGFAIGFINSADITYFIIVAVLFFTFAVWSVESERQWA